MPIPEYKRRGNDKYNHTLDARPLPGTERSIAVPAPAGLLRGVFRNPTMLGDSV